MKKWLLVLLISVSSPVFAAEKIVHDGESGTFFKSDDAKELLKIVEVKYPDAQEENKKLLKKIELQEQLIDITEKKSKVDAEIAEKWRKAYESAATHMGESDENDGVSPYVVIGVFLGGTIVGACIMYTSSALLNTLK